MTAKPDNSDKLAHRGAIVFLGVFTLLNVLAFFAQRHMQAVDKAGRALYARFDDPRETPRRDTSTAEHLEQYWRFIPDARTQRLAIVVGMSQMYWINDRASVDRTISEWIDDAYQSKGVRAFGLAAPNLDNEEALFYLLATTVAPETHPYAMVYGVCFDKFRNTDIRPTLQSFLLRRPDLLRDWKRIAERYSGRYPQAAEKMLGTLRDIEAARNKVAEQSLESRLRDRLAAALPIVAARRDLNGKLLQILFDLRNFVFNIKASTKRPIIGARYDLNRQFLEMLADEARARNVKLLPYIIPLNTLAETPYVTSEYEGFKAWYAEFTKARGLRFVNFENLVPAAEWGLSSGEPDFKHFSGAGHKRTAAAVGEAFAADLLEGMQGAAP